MVGDNTMTAKPMTEPNELRELVWRFCKTEEAVDNLVAVVQSEIDKACLEDRIGVAKQAEQMAEDDPDYSLGAFADDLEFITNCLKELQAKSVNKEDE